MSKKKIYKNEGEKVDRKEHENILTTVPITGYMQAISSTYHKILRVDLSKDRYEVVKMNPKDRAFGYGTDSFSSWLGQFIYDGGIHPDDMNTFISFTRPEHMKKVLESGEKAPSCCYRRRSGDDFRWNLMEVVPDSDKDSPYIYVYVKDIHDIFRESLELDEASARVQEVIRTLGEQNFGVYGVDLDTGEANLVRENGHTHTGWKSWTLQWDEIVNSRLMNQIHPADRDSFCERFSLEGLRRMKDTDVQKAEIGRAHV